MMLMKIPNDDAEVSSDDLEDNVAYLEWYNRAKEDTQEMRAEKYEQFISDGMEDEQARIRAHGKIVWAITSKFFDTYSRFLEETVLLKEDETHQDILLDIEHKTEKRNRCVQGGEEGSANTQTKIWKPVSIQRRCRWRFWKCRRHSRWTTYEAYATVSTLKMKGWL